MNTLIRLALLTSLALLAATPGFADERAFTTTAKSGSDEHKAEAAETVARKAVTRILKDEGLEDQIEGKALDALVTKCVPLLKRQKLRERRGKWRFSAKVDLERVRAKVIEARDQATGGAKVEVVAIVKVGGSTAPEAVRNAVSEVLRKSGYTVLDVDPKTAPKKALVVALKLGVAFEASPAGTAEAVMFSGRYRMQGTVYQAYDKVSGTVRFRGQVRSESSKSDLVESDKKSLAEPRVRKGESSTKVQEAYTIHAAQWTARLVVQKLNEIRAKDIADGGGPRTRYTLRLKGFAENEVKALHRALQARKDVSEFKELGKLGIFQIARFKVAGDAAKVAKAVLGKAGLDAKISKSGVNLTLVKKGGK
jgi:hypothetical protein